MKVLKRFNKTFVDSVAYKCLDQFFKDFEEYDYAQAIDNAQRSLAKKYKILNRIARLTLEPGDLTDKIILPFDNFDSETKVTINNILFHRAPTISEDYTYYLEYLENTWQFDYKNKQLLDTIEIEYLITDEKNYESNGNLVLPDIYEDEIIRIAVQDIAKLGIAKFTEEKSNKYTKIYRLNSKETLQLDPNLSRHKVFKEIEIFNGID